MRRRTIILIHIVIWLLTSLTYFFLSEKLTALILPDIYDVVIWLKVLTAGLIIFFLITVISLLLNIRSRNNKVMRRHEKLDIVLKYMANNLKEPPTKPSQIAERAGLNIESTEAHLMLDMMHKDGYVSKKGDNAFYEILYKGLIFIDNGGYTRESYVAKRQILSKTISDYVDIIIKPVGIITALAVTTWTIIQILKFLGTVN